MAFPEVRAIAFPSPRWGAGPGCRNIQHPRQEREQFRCPFQGRIVPPEETSASCRGADPCPFSLPGQAGKVVVDCYGCPSASRPSVPVIIRQSFLYYRVFPSGLWHALCPNSLRQRMGRTGLANLFLLVGKPTSTFPKEEGMYSIVLMAAMTQGGALPAEEARFGGTNFRHTDAGHQYRFGRRGGCHGCYGGGGCYGG